MRVGLHHLSLWWAGLWSGVWLLRKGLCYDSIVGSVVECSPATRAARVRFPDDAVQNLLGNLPFG